MENLYPKSENRQIIEDVFEKNQTVFIQIISEYYPLSNTQLFNFSSCLDWYRVSLNENVDWSLELIEKYIDKWPVYDPNYRRSDWSGLLSNKKLPWTSDLISRLF